VNLYIPDGVERERALQRCNYMAVGAHQDDLEIMAYHGILNCYNNSENWFCGVTMADGCGGPRKKGYEKFSSKEISAIRNKEQNIAADLGQYGAMFQFNLPSSAIKSPNKKGVVSKLLEVLQAVKPRVVYTHNPADKHDTHVGVLLATLQAIHQLPLADRPDKLYGCEVWRDLDWLDDVAKIRLNVTGHDELALSLIKCFESQVTDKKRYDLATLGRRRANATYSDAHSNSVEEQVTYAMDLSDLIRNESQSLIEYTLQQIKTFENKVCSILSNQLGE